MTTDIDVAQRKLSRKDLLSVFLRMHLFQATLNFERMEALGYAFVMAPVLKKLYDTKESLRIAIKRHLEFFNTQTTVCSFVFGLTAAMEEKGGNEADRAIAGVKAALMGPLAGIGDSLIWGTWMPVTMSIGASLASNGNFAGPLLAWLLFNLVNVPAKYFGVMTGYYRGMAFLEDIKSSGQIYRLTTLFSVIGLMVVGSLIPSLVPVTTPLKVQVGTLSISVQDTLNSIMPNILPLIFTLLALGLIRKRWSNLRIVLFLIALSIVLSALGIIN